jgi:hypothetical protein
MTLTPERHVPLTAIMTERTKGGPAGRAPPRTGAPGRRPATTPPVSGNAIGIAIATSVAVATTAGVRLADPGVDPAVALTDGFCAAFA